MTKKNDFSDPRQIEKAMNKLFKSFMRTGKGAFSGINRPYVKDHASLMVAGFRAKAYHLYVSLEHSPVKTYRRITVASDVRLEHLAQIIIRAMGWDNTHLHQFILGDNFFIAPETIENYSLMARDTKLDAMAYAVGDVLKEKGDTIKLEYDFGDSWMHNVRLSSIEEYDVHNVVSLDSGKGACPPEDIGGVWGYAEWLEEEEELPEFDLAAAQEAVGDYVSEVIKSQKMYQPIEDKIRKKRSARPLPHTFTVKDIRGCHPEDLAPFATDQEYALLANRIERAIIDRAYVDGFSNEELELAVGRIIMYYEDIIADSGQWRGFVNKNMELYSKPLPFYDLDDDYQPDEPHKADIQLLIWSTLCEFENRATIKNPENPAIEQMAEVVYEILDEEFENIGINENLAEYFKKAEFAANFYKLRNVLKWALTTCYLTSDLTSALLYNEPYERVSLFFEGKVGSYTTQCARIMDTKVGMLALLPTEWIAAFVEAKGNHQVAKSIAGIETTAPAECFKVDGLDARNVTLTGAKGRSLTVGRVENYGPNDDRFEKGVHVIASFAKYNGKWWLNGGQCSLPGLTDEDAKELDGGRGEGVDEKRYQRAMKLSGSSPLFYFKDYKQLTDFVSKELGWTKDEIESFDYAKGEKNITLYIDGKDRLLYVIPQTANAIRDERNPYYDPRTASETAMSMVFDADAVPGEIVRYLIKNKMLPDARFNSLKGESHGRELVQQNLDFLARAIRREKY